MLTIIVKNEKRNYSAVYMKRSRNFGSNFSDFFFSASFWHSGKQLSSILRAQSGDARGSFPDLARTKGRAREQMEA